MPKTTRNIGLSELRVGLLVLIAIGVLVVLILNASGTLNPFASHLHLRARFAPDVSSASVARGPRVFITQPPITYPSVPVTIPANTSTT